MGPYAHIVGWGKYVPDRIVTNHDLAEIMDTSDDWIKSRTGISQRRFAGENETTASMAIEAAKVALDRARIAPASVDLIIVATFSPEHIFPSTACIVQDAIGATNAGAFDLSAACAGFSYAFSMGSAMIQSGSAKVVLVIGSETTSRFLNDQDRGTYPLFGDGAGALVLQGSETPGGILANVLGADGSGAEHLLIPAGGSKLPTCQDTLDNRLHYMQMNGREVYRFATRVMGRVAKQACEQAGVDLDDIDLFIPHQANIRIIKSATKYLKISEDKVFTNLHKYGNTSAASIPLALCEAIEEGRIKNKDKIVMVGFGGGLVWGATVVEWGLPKPYIPRQWWYRRLREWIYTWAKVRSNFVRIWRNVEDRLFYRNGMNEDIPTTIEKPVEKPPEEVGRTYTNGHGSNGNGSKPAPMTLPTKQPEETDEQEKVLERD